VRKASSSCSGEFFRTSSREGRTAVGRGVVAGILSNPEERRKERFSRKGQFPKLHIALTVQTVHNNDLGKGLAVELAEDAVGNDGCQLNGQTSVSRATLT
jgi:hypothetical protein